MLIDTLKEVEDSLTAAEAEMIEEDIQLEVMVMTSKEEAEEVTEEGALISTKKDREAAIEEEVIWTEVVAVASEEEATMTSEAEEEASVMKTWILEVVKVEEVEVRLFNTEDLEL